MPEKESPSAQNKSPGGLRLKPREPDALSSNPMLERCPEPPRGGPRRRMPWGVIVFLIVLAGLVVGTVRYGPALLGREDLRVWDRARQWVASHADGPGNPRALSDLKEIIRATPSEAKNAEARAALMALHGLGSLQTGALNDWRATVGILERDMTDSAMVALVRDVKLDSTVTVKCPVCGGSGKCRNCDGKGEREAPGLTRSSGLSRGSARRSGEIGSSLDTSSSMEPCPVCNGTGRCRECKGKGTVTTRAGVPVANQADLERRWTTAVEEAHDRVRVRYWKARLAHELDKARQLIAPDEAQDAIETPQADVDALPDPDWPATPPGADDELASLRAIFAREKAKLDEDPSTRDEKLRTLTGMYVGHLAELEQKLARGDRTDQARAVREEIARVSLPGTEEEPNLFR